MDTPGRTMGSRRVPGLGGGRRAGQRLNNSQRAGAASRNTASMSNGFDPTFGLTEMNTPLFGNQTASAEAFSSVPATNAESSVNSAPTPAGPPHFGFNPDLFAPSAAANSTTPLAIPTTLYANNSTATGLAPSTTPKSKIPSLGNLTNTPRPPISNNNMMLLTKSTAASASTTDSAKSVASLSSESKSCVADTDQDRTSGSSGPAKLGWKMNPLKNKFNNDTTAGQMRAGGDTRIKVATQADTVQAHAFEAADTQIVATNFDPSQAANAQTVTPQSMTLTTAIQYPVDKEVKMRSPPEDVMRLSNNNAVSTTIPGDSIALLPMNSSRSYHAPVMQVLGKSDGLLLSRRDITEVKGLLKTSPNVRTMGKEFVRSDQKHRPKKSCLGSPEKARARTSQKTVRFGGNRVQTLGQETRVLRDRVQRLERAMETSDHGISKLQSENRKLCLELETSKKEFEALTKRSRALERENEEIRNELAFPDATRTGYKRKISQLEDQNHRLEKDINRLADDKAYWYAQFTLQMDEKRLLEERYECELKQAIKKTQMRGFSGVLARKPIEYIKQSANEIEILKEGEWKELSDTKHSNELLREQNGKLRARLRTALSPTHTTHQPREIPSWAEHVSTESSEDVLQDTAFRVVTVLAAISFAGYLARAVVSYLT